VSNERVKARGAGCLLAAIAVVAFAACGSSTAKPASGSGSTTSQAQTSTSGSPAVVATASSTKLGPVLVDSAGKTLYTLTNTAGAPVPCTGQCLTFWPPLVLPAGATTATGAAGVTGLATVTTSGGMQVTKDGAPLYRFSADAAAGDTNGEGISSFGGTWHAVKVSAAPGAAPTSASPATAGATTSSGGYGYP
jgi:predicted lipoprotein with Yx(FWY)xxD motif